ncbi:MAG: V-type ATP synthase subunit F [Candidatus Thalassarchaeaceae archaeon]|jgi:V/A-type H+-transporting ATPase subunit F|nr:V-type ATP synthase subunit F [Euryarchaeota archaeon]MDP7092044.1 V-type ATP synthase subunit F [Candidatus Thalassarchaeaceae archaeon]MBV43492.1 V-type ATP synthase subunit F [Euryarchaeota archaeon]MDP7256776.1 V-type ATP synthase subunit F [Candidatus Thalassarchaeaceae archaeon]MDP7446016.1 V-type ATP synthase subunit F [Candidatus Thalassarchaeaceae archaeon]|tara:strand:- start:3838 stop:4137 length:300 start_codon:yes stop_codon:yes gene_type:complete
MEIAIVGTSEFTLGFQLAGITQLHNPENEDEMSRTLRSMLDEKEVGIIVVDAADLTRVPDKLRQRLADSISPTVLGIGTEEDNTLRESIKSALGVDLWK